MSGDLAAEPLPHQGVPAQRFPERTEIDGIDNHILNVRKNSQVPCRVRRGKSPLDTFGSHAAAQGSRVPDKEGHVRGDLLQVPAEFLCMDDPLRGYCNIIAQDRGDFPQRFPYRMPDQKDGPVGPFVSLQEFQDMIAVVHFLLLIAAVIVLKTGGSCRVFVAMHRDRHSLCRTVPGISGPGSSHAKKNYIPVTIGSRTGPGVTGPGSSHAKTNYIPVTTGSRTVPGVSGPGSPPAKKNYIPVTTGSRTVLSAFPQYGKITRSSPSRSSSPPPRQPAPAQPAEQAPSQRDPAAPSRTPP